MLGAAPRGREAEDGVESPPLLPAERLHLLQRRSARTRKGRPRRGPLLPPQRDPENSADRAARRVHSPVSETRARRQRPLKGGVSGRGPGGLLASLWLGWGKALSAEPCRRRISGAHRGSQARVQEMEFSGVTASCPRAPPVLGSLRRSWGWLAVRASSGRIRHVAVENAPARDPEAKGVWSGKARKPAWGRGP